MRRYRVTYRRDEGGWWVASVRGVRGCHTQGRTIREARERAREALGLFVRGADHAVLVDEIQLPARARVVLVRLRAARERAKEEEARAAAAAQEAVRRLTEDLRLSRRDAGELVELSHQRVQQLLRA